MSSACPATSGASQTTFTHSGIVEWPTGGIGGGGGGLPPAPMAISAQNDTSKASFAADVNGKIQSLEFDMPPVPWDPATWMPTKTHVEGQNMALTSTASDPVGCIGFYRVVRAGIHMHNLPNNAVLSGTVNLNFEVGNPSTSTLMGIYVNNADGQPINGLSVLPLDRGTLQAVWNTTLVPNGIYVLQPGMLLDLDTDLLGDSVTVVVNNSISFPNVWPIAGDAMRIEAKTIHANGSWIMDFYDDQDNFWFGLDGQVDANGYCNLGGYPGPGFSVGIVDANNVQYAPNYYVVEVATFPAGSGLTTASSVRSASTTSAATSKITIFVERNWNYRTRTAIAYQQLFNENNIPGQAVNGMMQIIALAAAGRYEGDPVNGTTTVPFALKGSSQWEELGLNLQIPEVRNFFYFGHGSASSIGNVPAEENLTIQDLNRLLVNESDDPMRGINLHPYRFVFLDACSTAKGDLCKAFGIPKGPKSREEFVDKRGLRPRAYLGWDSTVLLALGTIDYGHINFIERFFDKWAHSLDQEGNPITLREAMARAAVTDSGASWLDAKHLVLHGYEGLYFEE